MFVAADGQLDAAESYCVTDLVSSTFSGSPRIFLLIDKPYLIHPSGRLNTKCDLSVNTYGWKVDGFYPGSDAKSVSRSLLTVRSVTICEHAETRHCFEDERRKYKAPEMLWSKNYHLDFYGAWLNFQVSVSGPLN